MSDDRVPSYVIGLGANLGDRRATLQSAVRALRGLGRVLSVSSLYETQALGPPQPDYLNAAVLLESGLGPRPLLDSLLAIERAHGRERRERWGARTLDLDLLHSPALVLQEPGLTLPHPELIRRPFALLPLLDVAPHAFDPRSDSPYAEAMRSLDAASVRRIEAADSWTAAGALDVGPGRTE